MVEINLLPHESATSKADLKMLSLAHKIAAFATGLFLILLVVGGGAYFFLANRLKDVKAEGVRLLANVQSLQSSESSLILIRDRVQKAQSAFDSRINEDYFAKQQNMLDLQSAGVDFSKSEISQGKLILEVNIANSSDMVRLFSTLLLDNDLKNLTISKLSFSPLSGYTVSMEVF